MSFNSLNKKKKTQMSDAVAWYQLHADNTKSLSREEERQLIDRIQNGDESAKQEFVEHNIFLVAKVVGTLSISSDMYDDIIQEGMVGLMTALNRFELNRGLKFSTYAVWWIRRFALLGIYRIKYSIHVPIHMQEEYRQVLSYYFEQYKATEQPPTVQDIAKHFGIPPYRVNYWLHQTIENASLDDSPLDDQNPLHYAIGQQEEQDFILEVWRQELREFIKKETERFSDRDQKFIMLRYQLDENGRQNSFRKVSREFKFSSTYGQEIEKRIIRYLSARWKNRKDELWMTN